MSAIVLLSCSASLPPSAQMPPAPAARNDGVEYHHGLFSGAHNIQLFEQSWRPHMPKASLVIVHGLLDHSSRYEAFARVLVTHGYAVHTFDLRGHAHSGGKRVYVEDFADYITDLERVVERVANKEPGCPLFLFGHSMGGTIAVKYAQSHPGLLAGLMLSAAALDVNASSLTVLMSRMVDFAAPEADVPRSVSQSAARTGGPRNDE